jgi:hypothetical protein
MVGLTRKWLTLAGWKGKENKKDDRQFCLFKVPPWYKPHKTQAHPPHIIKKVN